MPFQGPWQNEFPIQYVLWLGSPDVSVEGSESAYAVGGQIAFSVNEAVDIALLETLIESFRDTISEIGWNLSVEKTGPGPYEYLPIVEPPE